ncbi:calcium/sodium antiporter [Xanthomarina sp. F2636L]|uniref:calcium/sodium antiporter n=1 Tax=Xanthomarina sp. F2636L TaxID=2996018 RepID=UPI00225E4461|nr:calcium/sodium antiporter [Xanthomarina sp. F2636L]MCX7551952.1 calcium/sodium antiporter [Xanthomarina sp. F2636L]
MSLIWIVLGLILLVVGGEFLVRSSVSLSFKFNISKLVIGMTVVSFATSAPELLVSLQAALDGSPDIALGNVIGSNIANIGLVLGITAIIAPLAISSDFYKLNWPMMMLLSIVLYFFLRSGGVLNFTEGLILFVSLIIFLVVLIKKSKGENEEAIDEVDDALQQTSNFKIVVWLLIGGAALYFGSSWLVFGAKEMALSYGVSERVISVTMVAIGTSVPELAASVIAAIKQEKAISLGNLIGSNIFNISSVLGLTAMIQPINLVNPKLLTNDIFWMIGFSAILIPFMLLPKKFEIGRLKGFIILGAYIFFVYSAFSAD